MGDEVHLPLLHSVNGAPSRQLAWRHGFLGKQIVRLGRQRLPARLSPLVERTHIHGDPDGQDEIPGTSGSHRPPRIGGAPLLGLRQVAGGEPQNFDLITHRGRRWCCLSAMPRRWIADGESVDVTRERLALAVSARALVAAAAGGYYDHKQRGNSQAQLLG